MKYGVRKIALFNALKHRRSEIDISGVAQLVGDNNLGKTSLIRAMNFLFIDNVAQGSHFGEYKWAETVEHYFPRAGGTPWIVFSARSKSRGDITIAITRGERERSLSRYVINHPYEQEMFVERKPLEGGRVGVRIRTEEQMLAFLREELSLEPKQIDLVREPQEWRRWLCDDPTMGKPGLGILPLPAKHRDETHYLQFRDLFSKMLDGKSYQMGELKATIVTLAGVRPSDAVLNFGADVATKTLLDKLLEDRARAGSALAVGGSFRELFEAGQTLQNAARTLHLFAQDHIGAVAARLEALRVEDEQKASAVERHQQAITAIEGQIRALREKSAASERERGGIEAKLAEHAQALQQAEVEEAGLMDARTPQELADAITAARVRLSAIPTGDAQHVKREIAALETEVAGVRRRIDLIEAGQESFGDYVLRVHGAKAAATLRAVLSAGVMGDRVADVLRDETLIKAISEAPEGAPIGLGLVNARVRAAAEGDAVADVEALREELAFKQGRLDKSRSALADLGKGKEIEAEIGRLEGMLAFKRLLEQLRSPEKSAELDQLRARDEVLKAEIAATAGEIGQQEKTKDVEHSAIRTLKNRKFDELRSKLTTLHAGFTSDLDAHFVPGDESVERPEGYEPMDTEGVQHEHFVEQITSVRGTFEKVHAEALRQCMAIWDRQDAKFRALSNMVVPGYVPTFLRADRTAADLMPTSDFMAKLEPVVTSAQQMLVMSEKSIRQTLSGQAKRAREFVQYLNGISKKIAELNAKLKKLRFSSLRDISLEMVRNEAKIDEISVMADAGASDMKLMDVENTVNGRHVYDYFRDMLSRGEVYQLHDMFSLNLHLQDQFGEHAHGTSTGKAGSNGTNMMTRVVMSALLLGKLFDERELPNFLIPVYVDEAADIDERNHEILVEVLTENGFNPVLAHPGHTALPMPVRFFVHQMYPAHVDGKSWVEVSSTELVGKKAVGSEEVEDAAV